MADEEIPNLYGIGAAATPIVLTVSIFAFFVRKSIVQGQTMGALKD